MPGAYVMVDPVNATLQVRPKAFCRIRTRHAIDEFFNTMINALVLKAKFR